MPLGDTADGGFPKHPRNYDLFKQYGLRCMTKVKDTVTGYANCGGYGVMVMKKKLFSILL